MIHWRSLPGPARTGWPPRSGTLGRCLQLTLSPSRLAPGCRPPSRPGRCGRARTGRCRRCGSRCPAAGRPSCPARCGRRWPQRRATKRSAARPPRPCRSGRSRAARPTRCWPRGIRSASTGGCSASSTSSSTSAARRSRWPARRRVANANAAAILGHLGYLPTTLQHGATDLCPRELKSRIHQALSAAGPAGCGDTGRRRTTFDADGRLGYLADRLRVLEQIADQAMQAAGSSGAPELPAVRSIERPRPHKRDAGCPARTRGHEDAIRPGWTAGRIAGTLGGARSRHRPHTSGGEPAPHIAERWRSQRLPHTGGGEVLRPVRPGRAGRCRSQAPHPLVAAEKERTPSP